MTSVTVTMPSNILSISLLDIHTTTYFLQAHTMLEEHKPAIKEEADPDEL